jgi:hypothetical protein
MQILRKLTDGGPDRLKGFLRTGHGAPLRSTVLSAPDAIGLLDAPSAADGQVGRAPVPDPGRELVAARQNGRVSGSGQPP